VAIGLHVARVRVGGIDDPIWSTPGPAAAPRRRMGAWRLTVSLLALPGLPLLAVLVRGFDWVDLVAGVAAGVGVLAVVHHRVVGPVALGVLLLVPAFGALEAVNRLEFHTFSLDGPPPKLHWCGRDYQLGNRLWPAPPPVIGSQGERVVLVSPSGSAILSGFACTRNTEPTLLFTPVGPSAWVAYGLDGGP
jgi:hypothetical protein